jgi:hypothetical protein
MAIADTAQLVVELTLKDSLSSAATGVQGAMSRVESAAGRMGNALGHAGSQLSGLITGPLGLIGLGGGLFGLEQLLSGSISKVGALGTAVQKLTALTGMNATESSTWLAILSRYGVDADTATTRFAFLEKTMGNLTLKSKTYSDFVKEFHFSLKNANGTVISVTTAMERLADVYASKTIPDSTKAALAAKLLGRGYVDMVPILALGSKGIADAAQTAQDLGLVLDATNAGALQRYHDSMLNMNEAVGGLDLQIGESLIPILSNLATTATQWLAGGGSTEIANWFKKGAQFAQDMGKAIQDDVLPVFKSIAGWWDSLPGDLKNLLIGAFVAQKASSWLFGGGGILGALSSLLSPVASKGVNALVPQNVFVTNWAMMGGGGAAAGAGEAAAGAGAGEAAAGAGAGEGAAAGAGAGVAAVALPVALIAVSVVATAAAAKWFADQTGQQQAGTNSQISSWKAQPTSQAQNASALAAEVAAYRSNTSNPLTSFLTKTFASTQTADALLAASDKLAKGTHIMPADLQAMADAMGVAYDMGNLKLADAIKADMKQAALLPRGETPAAPATPGPSTGGAGATEGSSWNLPGGGTETVPGAMTAADHTRLNKAGSAGRKDVLKQLHGKYNAGRAQADSTAITTDYTSGAAYNNSSLAANIATLVSLQKDAKEHGDPKTAALLGTNIQTLRDLLSGKTLPSGKTAGPGMGSTWHLPGGGTETSGAFTPQSLSQAVRTGFAAAQINVSVSVRDINNGQTTSTSWGAGKPQ